MVQAEERGRKERNSLSYFIIFYYLFIFLFSSLFSLFFFFTRERVYFFFFFSFSFSFFLFFFFFFFFFFSSFFPWLTWAKIGDRVVPTWFDRSRAATSVAVAGSRRATMVQLGRSESDSRRWPPVAENQGKEGWNRGYFSNKIWRTRRASKGHELGDLPFVE